MAAVEHAPSNEALTTANLHLNRIGEWSVSTERGPGSGVDGALLALVAAAMSIALIGAFTSVGLAQAEGRADASTLAAVGASPILRRQLAAMQALTIGRIGTLLGTVAGLAAGWGIAQLRISPSGSSSVTFSGAG